MKLRRDNQLITPVLNGLPDDPFRLAIRVDVGGVDQVDTRV
jgi:hypothetical protein